MCLHITKLFNSSHWVRLTLKIGKRCLGSLKHIYLKARVRKRIVLEVVSWGSRSKSYEDLSSSQVSTTYLLKAHG